MGSSDDGLESQRRWILHLVTRPLRAAGTTEIEYDTDEQLLRYRGADGSRHVANMGNLFHDCIGQSADDRAAHIERFVAMLTAEPEVPREWDQVAPQLRPVLRPPRYVRAPDQLQLPIARAFQPLLNELVVIDQPHAMAYVTMKQVREWGVAEPAVFDRARANLAALPTARPFDDASHGGAILRFVDSGDEYWASHLLVDGWLAALADGVGGRPVAFLPDPTGLMVVADEPGVIGQILEMTEKQYREATRPLSPQPYTIDDAGRVVPYAVPVGDPLWNAVHRSEVLLASQEYAAQGKPDDPLEGFVASLMVNEQPDGAVYSVTVWGEGVYGLLPRADYVAFVNESGHFTVPWELVARETGLVPEAGWSPVRYRVETWPDPAILERLRAAAVEPGPGIPEA